MVNINVDTSDVTFPTDKIGVDMGQSLSKIAYLESGKINLLDFLTQSELPSIRELLDSKIDRFKKINFTGGKCFNLSQTYSHKAETNLLNEFETSVKGIETIYLMEKKKELPPSLIVTIGTGTSMVSKKDSVKHLGGTAMGGGYFMALIKLLFNLNDFQEALNLAKKGNRYNVDLKVSDIYASEDDRVDLLFREFTASSLGKINSNFKSINLIKEDVINSLICMIGENIGTIANLMAENNDISNLVFCGGFVKENKILKKILSLMCKVNRKNSIFLKNSEFCAAIGALLL